MTAPQAHMLSDGRRLHLHHGPIDLIVEVWGAARIAAFARATTAFETVLEALVTELPALRRMSTGRVNGPVAQRMVQASTQVTDALKGEPFLTPMAAVAGSVADHVLAAMKLNDATPKAYVNNGGDIAIHLATGNSMALASPSGQMTIRASDTARGVATSGWGGRSHSLGIADAVTVTAGCSSIADAAATLIANAVDLPGHPAIRRTPARDLSPDSDLGARLVTTDVGPLTATEIDTALNGGASLARRLQRERLIFDTALRLQGVTRHLTHDRQGTLLDA